MEAFTMTVAGLTVRVQPLFETTRAYCAAYLTNEEPLGEIRVLREDLIREQALLDREAMEEGLKRRKFSDPFLERSVIQRRMADQLVQRNTLMLHGSTVAVDGKAYLFTAPCGTGKSTHTRLWRKVFGFRAIMVNDDKPFLRVTQAGALAFGSPWTGKHGLGNNVCYPLEGICVLSRGAENRIRRAERAEVQALLLAQCHVPEGDAAVPGLLEELLCKVPLWTMECTKEPDAALMAYRAMSGDQE